jgi:transcriptional pleiotropic regulator of transition state genes
VANTATGNIWEAIVLKSTGIVRKVDELGRIVLPIELRRTLDINEKDSLEIFVDEGCIMLKKYEPACIFCGSADGIVSFNGKNVCSHCLEELRK